MFCFFPTFSKLSYRLSDIFTGAEGQNKAAAVKCSDSSILSPKNQVTLLSVLLTPFCPPSMPCVMGCYPKEYLWHTQYNSQRTGVKHQQHSSSPPCAFLVNSFEDLYKVKNALFIFFRACTLILNQYLFAMFYKGNNK